MNKLKLGCRLYDFMLMVYAFHLLRWGSVFFFLLKVLYTRTHHYVAVV